jgi:hypothetical protein
MRRCAMARRDESQTVQVGLRVKEALRRDLEEAAAARGLSMNAEIVRRLERSFERRDHVIDGVGLGAELYKALALLASIQSRINGALVSTVPDFHDVKPALSSFRDTVIEATSDISSAQDRIVKVLETLLPSDRGLELSKRGEDIRIVTRTIQDEDQ